jgi:hypothetical protein
MDDSTNKNRQEPPPWGDDAENALIARNRLLRFRAKVASSPPGATRIRVGIVVVICTTALLGFLLILLLVGHKTAYRSAIGLSNKHKPAGLLTFEQCDEKLKVSYRTNTHRIALNR